MLFLYGCSDVSDVQKNIYNDDKLIQKQGDSFYFKNRIGGTANTKFELEYSTFYGDETIWNINVKEQGEIKFDFVSVVDSGKFKAVLVTEKEVITIFEGNKSGGHTAIVPEGKYRLKIVGNDAKGNVTIELKLDKNMSANPKEN